MLIYIVLITDSYNACSGDGNASVRKHINVCELCSFSNVLSSWRLLHHLFWNSPFSHFHIHFIIYNYYDIINFSFIFLGYGIFISEMSTFYS